MPLRSIPNITWGKLQECVWGKKQHHKSLLCSAVAITENEIEHKQTPCFSIISNQPQSKMHPREFSRNAVQKTEGNMNQVTCTQLSVLPAAQPSPWQVNSHFPHCSLGACDSACSAMPAWQGMNGPTQHSTGNNRWVLVSMFWQQATHRKKEAALKSFTAPTSTLQLPQIHTVFATSEIWSTSLFLDIFIRTTFTFISLKEMQQIPEPLISLQIFLLVQLFVMSKDVP